MSIRSDAIESILQELTITTVTGYYRDDHRYKLLHRFVVDAVLASDRECLTLATDGLTRLEADRRSNNLPAEAEYFGRLSRVCQQALEKP